ncbi:hypothetical protein B9Z55_026266 [Caenorhabditis nigoni]|uniref:Arrestin C-terminal-like domain-containing protein n=1 Tax=Caenorhabditis nigoni TaxID=1611254 RepID=A0A2G5T213_9PELO|nr:hypothetical protein B9Z55_026266 [Caenorhabditis nigoni]
MGRSASKSNKTEKKVFRVFSNSEPDNTKITKETEKDIGTIFKKGVVKMTVSIPKQTLVPGEVLPITLEIDNTSKRSATCIRAELHQRSDFYCQNTPITVYSNHHRIESKRLAKNQKDINIESQTQGLEKLEVKIPYVLPPTVKCPIIENRYYLSVELVTATSLNNTLYCEFDIIMVPKRNREDSSSSSSIPSASPAIHRAESLPPPYSSATRTASSAPPTYEESTTKPFSIEFR